ncbi:MAG: diaminopimelate epimerase [Frankiaceae bacterium]
MPSDGAGGKGRSVAFTKLVAAGNDFVLVDEDRSPAVPPISEFSRWACRRDVGIGADGVLMMRRTGADSVNLVVANPDGSIAKMCGNGARCGAYYALTHGLAAPLTMTFAGRDRDHSLQARSDGGLIEMTSPQPHAVGDPIEIDGFDFYSVDTGTEYAVTFVDAVDAVDVPEVGRLVRYHPRFAPGGTSVTFAQVTPDGLRARTYERGNEAETLSCSSGAVAAAVVARHAGLQDSEKVRVHNRSYAPLLVRLDGRHLPGEPVTVSGPVEPVFTGTIPWRDSWELPETAT